MSNIPFEVLATVAVAFIAAGLIKGIVGMGLPTVSLALLTATLGVKQAIVLVLVPSMVTNLWQALTGNALKEIVRRLWSLLTTAVIGIWFGSALLARADADLVAGFLGLLLCAYSGYSLAAPQIRPPGRHEPWLTPLVGAVAGAIAGLTGSFAVPGILYLQALGLARDTLVQAMGVVFVVLTVALGISLSDHGLVSTELGILSVAAVAPAVLGLVAGRRIRRRLPETTFRTVFFCALLAIGLAIAVRAFL
jgi:uncharacterized protein